ncbi:MAG: sodium:solute symporter [Bacteroides sp.]|nr:sodium:solute symporter [Bacteroides sp.]
MSPLLIVLTVAVYFALLFTVSYVAGRKADNAGFFTGNRRSSWYVVAFAMIGASMSGVTYVSVPGMVGGSSFSYLQMTLGFVAGQLVIAFVLTPLFYRMNLTSIYQYLQNRFGTSTYRAGAWFFFISKMLGAAVRLLLVCTAMQLLVFEPWEVPFVVNVAISVSLVWLYTYRGGVKSLVWTDSLKTLCLIVSVVMCIYYIADGLELTAAGVLQTVTESPMSRILFLDNPDSKLYFWKQFLGGMFTMIAMTGLDQDLMQRNLSCRSTREAQKNMMVSISMQVVVITLFLMLGVLLYTFAASRGLQVSKGDDLFPLVATGAGLPVVVGVLFIIGFISSAYSAAGSALTALTTSFTVDIVGTGDRSEESLARLRKHIHLLMAVLMAVVIYVIGLLNNTSIIDAVYTLASYTYGPILGLFAFGILLKRHRVRDRYIPVVCILSPLLCLFLQLHSESWLDGYQLGYELLLLNAALTFLGAWMVSDKNCSQTNK